MLQQRVRNNWVRRMEHGVLRVVSLGFSLASAHAIRWFFAPLDHVDALQPAITWMVAIGFGLLGYFVSRGLAHRLMNGESIKAYAPICFVVELVEIICNYALAAAVIQQATWLDSVPAAQRALLTDATYLVLAIIPLVSLLLAVVDMDLERKKDGGMAAGVQRLGQLAGRAMPGKPAQNGANYPQGYPGIPAVQASTSYVQGSGAQKASTNGGGFKFPFPRRGDDAAAQPKDTMAGRSMLLDPDKELARIP